MHIDGKKSLKFWKWCRSLSWRMHPASFICKKFATIENSVWIFLLHQISSVNFINSFFFWESRFSHYLVRQWRYKIRTGGYYVNFDSIWNEADGCDGSIQYWSTSDIIHIRKSKERSFIPRTSKCLGVSKSFTVHQVCVMFPDTWVNSLALIYRGVKAWHPVLLVQLRTLALCLQMWVNICCNYWSCIYPIKCEGSQLCPYFQSTQNSDNNHSKQAKNF